MKNVIFGYARVSTKEQNLTRQIEELKAAGADERHIYTDKQSGKDFDRPEYNNMLDRLDAGDTVIITALDRLGRNYTEIRQQWQLITEDKRANIKVLDMPLLDTTANKNLDGKFIADLVLQILSYVAEKERLSNKARRESGYNAMTEKEDINGKTKKFSTKTGRPQGRPAAQTPENFEKVYKSWKAGEITARQAMQELSLTRCTFYNLVKRYESPAN